MHKTIKFILDLIFPINCLGCNKEGTWLCETCIKKIPIYQKQLCLWCGKTNINNELCSECQKQSGLTKLFVLADYQNKIIQELLHNLKYNFAFTIKDSLQLLIKRFLEESLNKKTIPFPLTIIPIPLHKKRLLERGFNQSEIIAHIISEKLNAQLLPSALIRIKNTTSQMTLSRKERLVNLKGAFNCPNPDLIKNKNILLVDDVLTTGSTLKEAAFVLKRQGARQVSAFVLAKEELQKIDLAEREGFEPSRRGKTPT